MEVSQKQRAIELLSEHPSKESLLTLITWLDLECATAPITALPQQILARAVVALGYALQQRHPYATVERTMHAAETFALEPTEAHFDLYQSAATDSYPFGPGDGCLAVPETGYAGCELGSGCRSGSGCLYVDQLGASVVMQAIAKQLMPWLQGAGDALFEKMGPKA